MSNFENIINDLYSEVKAMTKEVEKKAEETIEISKLNMERIKIRSRIQQNYQRLGEIIYGSYKNEEDVSDIVAALYEQLDEDFERVEGIYNEICSVKNGIGVSADGESRVCEEEKTKVKTAQYEEEQKKPLALSEKPNEEVERAQNFKDVPEVRSEPEPEAVKDESQKVEENAAEVAKRRRTFGKNGGDLGIDVDAD